MSDGFWALVNAAVAVVSIASMALLAWRAR